MAGVPAESLPLLLFIVGIALTAAEALIPGAHFIVLGVALMIAGLLGLSIGPLGTPIGLALSTLIVGGVTLWIYRNFEFYQGVSEASPMDSDSLKGKDGSVTEEVTPTGGEVKLKGGGFNPYYRARSIDETLPVGTEIVVLQGGGGNVVTVAPVEVLEDDIDRELAAERERRERELENTE